MEGRGPDLVIFFYKESKSKKKKKFFKGVGVGGKGLEFNF